MFGFGNNELKLEIEEEKTKRELKNALINACAGKKHCRIVTDSKEVALIQLAGIKSVRQEKKGWYYDDNDRDTLMIKYLDDSWERLDMTVDSFCNQTGYHAQ